MSGRDNPIPISDTDVPAAHKKSTDESTTTTSAQRPASPSTKLVDDVADRNGGCSTTNGQLRNSIEMEQHQHQQLTDNGDEVKRDDQTDFFMLPPFNINGYASKKSLAQGMLDLALLAANAAQLKFILTAGDSHPFYTLLLVLVLASICLQVFQVIFCIILGLILDLSKVDQHRRATICNDICIVIIVVVVALNVVISAFDMRVSSSLARLADGAHQMG